MFALFSTVILCSVILYCNVLFFISIVLAFSSKFCRNSHYSNYHHYFILPLFLSLSFSIFVLEKARSKVYGSWASLLGNTSTTTSTTTSFSVPSSSGPSIDQKACICCLAGPSGSGKRTLMQGIAYDLGRCVRVTRNFNFHRTPIFLQVGLVAKKLKI